MQSADKKYRQEYPQPHPPGRKTKNNSATPHEHANVVNQADSSKQNIHAGGRTHPQTSAFYPHPAEPTTFPPQQSAPPQMPPQVPPQQYLSYQNYVGQPGQYHHQTFSAPYQQTGMGFHPNYPASPYSAPAYPASAYQASAHLSDDSFRRSQTLLPQHFALSEQPVKKDHEETSRHLSRLGRHHSCPGRSMEMGDSNSKESALSDITSSTTSETPGITFIGNPGSGKSTLLNGIAGKVVFPAGLSLGTGMTTFVSEHVRNGVSLFDTPGLADIDQKKQAGQQLDIMLSKPIPLKIAFVVTLERGRVRLEDAVTIDLVLDAIKDDTDNKFGVIINRVSKRVRNEIALPEIEKKIQRSITGKHSTSHWCYIDLRDDLLDKNDERLMTPDLDRFLQRLPETKQKHTRTIPIDTDSAEDEMEIQRELIRDIELGHAEELRKKKEAKRLKKEEYDKQEAALLRKEQDLSAKLNEPQVESPAGSARQDRKGTEARPSQVKHQGWRSKHSRWKHRGKK